MIGIEEQTCYLTDPYYWRLSGFTAFKMDQKLDIFLAEIEVIYFDAPIIDITRASSHHTFLAMCISSTVEDFV